MVDANVSVQFLKDFLCILAQTIKHNTKRNSIKTTVKMPVEISTVNIQKCQFHVISKYIQNFGDMI